MTTKIVFFDMMGTLVHFAPEPEDLLVAAAAERGIPIDIRDARRGFATAGEWWNRQTARQAIMTDAERDASYTDFDVRVLRAVGVDVEPSVARSLLDSLISESGKPTLSLYDDVLPALSILRDRNVRMGIISNIGRELPNIVEALGIAAYFDVLVSSAAAGYAKPDPRIFEWGIRQAAVQPNEAAHVGDQYENDVLGAKGAGVQPVLVDRYGLLEDKTDCIRVESLTMVYEALANL